MIVETQKEENFMQIMQLRHPLIEVQERGGLYVPNDIVMGIAPIWICPIPPP